MPFVDTNYDVFLGEKVIRDVGWGSPPSQRLRKCSSLYGLATRRTDVPLPARLSQQAKLSTISERRATRNAKIPCCD